MFRKKKEFVQTTFIHSAVECSREKRKNMDSNKYIETEIFLSFTLTSFRLGPNKFQY